MIVCENLCKDLGHPPLRILHHLTFNVEDGEFISISGRSGSGKSTLLYSLSTLDMPTEGKIIIDGQDMRSLDSPAIHEFRNRYVGFIFQFHYLLPELTALENVLLPARNLGLMEAKRSDAMKLAREMDIESQMHKFPGQMSGGQQQRVAIARALIMKPRYIFADEPTGNLDSENAQVVMNILQKINRENKTTVVLVTHEPEFAALAHREIFLVDGKIGKR